MDAHKVDIADETNSKQETDLQQDELKSSDGDVIDATDAEFRIKVLGSKILQVANRRMPHEISFAK